MEKRKKESINNNNDKDSEIFMGEYFDSQLLSQSLSFSVSIDSILRVDSDNFAPTSFHHHHTLKTFG